MNEGYPTLLWGNDFALSQNLNKGLSDITYTFEVFPVIKEDEKDHRDDFKCDFTLMKLKNWQTIIVCELKLSVGLTLSKSDMEGLAQLFYEIKLVVDFE